MTELSKLSNNRATELLMAGSILENVAIEEIVLKNTSLKYNIQFCGCKIGKLSFQNCTFLGTIKAKDTEFTGKIELNKTDPNKKFQVTVFEEEVLFESCHFKDEVLSNDAVFRKLFATPKTKFHGRVNFSRAKFFYHALFSKTQFVESSNFAQAQFHDLASFEESIFVKKTNFKKTFFHEPAHFRKAIFEEGATFENSTFRAARFENIVSKKKIIFKVACFQSKTYFHGAKFEDEAIFRGCEICDRIYLDRINCDGKIDFSGIESFNTFRMKNGQFKKLVDFSDAIMHHDVSLRDTQFYGEISFQRAIFKLRLDCTGTMFFQGVILSGTSTNSIIIKREQVENKISSELKQEFDQAKEVYMLLRRSFEVLGDHEATDWAYYKFRQVERKSQKKDLKRFLEWLFFDLGAGYGTKPLNVVILAGFIIISFSFIYWMNDAHFFISPDLRENGLSGMSFAQAFYMSCMTFTTLGMEGIAPKFDHWVKYLFVFEGFCGLFLMTVFVGTYTRKMVK